MPARSRMGHGLTRSPGSSAGGANAPRPARGQTCRPLNPPSLHACLDVDLEVVIPIAWRHRQQRAPYGGRPHHALLDVAALCASGDPRTLLVTAHETAARHEHLGSRPHLQLTRSAIELDDVLGARV